MNGARKVPFAPDCDGEDCPFTGRYHVYDRFNKQVGGAWCEDCASHKVRMLDAYDPPLSPGQELFKALAPTGQELPK